jgi:hypothetical protein
MNFSWMVLTANTASRYLASTQIVRRRSNGLGFDLVQFESLE